MKKDEPEVPIKVIIVNQPTKKQAEQRVKELALYLEKVWKNPQNMS